MQPKRRSKRTQETGERPAAIMIEIHTHVLPDLDDGAADQGESEALLLAYMAQGATDLVCTSHFGAAQLRMIQQDAYFCGYEEKINRLRRWLAAGGRDLRLHNGHELVLIPDLLLFLQQHRDLSLTYLTLAGSAYLLVELPHWLSGGIKSLERLLFNVRMAGYEPILAHPERIVDFAEVQPVLQQWVEQEWVYLQINASALVEPQSADRQERFQQRRSRVDQLIRQGLVSFAASDAHNMVQRPPQLDRLDKVLRDRYSPAIADLLLRENPQAVLDDRPVRRPQAQ